MNFDKDEILGVLPGVARRPSPQGWYSFDCPYCGKKGHAGLKFESSGKYNLPSFNCFKCGESGSIFKLMKELGQIDLIDGSLSHSQWDKIENRFKLIEDEEINTEVQSISKPLGFRRIKNHPYLAARGFTKDQFEKYEVGKTRLIKKLKDYVIFLIRLEGEIVGYIGRSTWFQEDIDEHNSNIDDGGYKHLKYLNSPGVDFSKILFGADEIVEETETVILVEGITDKFNVERNLGLDDSPRVKCCSTFGKKISIEQRLVLAKKGVSNLILMYDPDAIDSSKRHGIELLEYFDVRVAFCSESDPGDMSMAEIIIAINEAEPPQNFNVNKVQKKKLI